ncbi:MAG: hypothetical protein JWM55_1221 [Acidimicrobiaceae bacterium]|nr:hypothetical protein [Acidimicrobiaceae bacterium]
MNPDSDLNKRIERFRLKVLMVKVYLVTSLLVSVDYDIHPWHTLWFNNVSFVDNIIATAVLAGFCIFVFVMFRGREGSVALPERSRRHKQVH